jgi:hypothetical protein
MMAGTMTEGATAAHGFPARLEARLSSKCGEGMPCGRGGEGRRSPEVPGQTPGLAILPAADVNASHQPGPRELCGRACFTKCRAELSWLRPPHSGAR